MTHPKNELDGRLCRVGKTFSRAEHVGNEILDENMPDQ